MVHHKIAGIMLWGSGITCWPKQIHARSEAHTEPCTEAESEAGSEARVRISVTNGIS